MNSKLSEKLNDLRSRSGETLLEWREPTAFRLKNEGLYFLGVAFVPSAMIAFTAIYNFPFHHPTPQDQFFFNFMIEFALVIGIGIFVGKLVFRPPICMNESGIKKSAMKNTRWAAYKNISSCLVLHRNSVKYSVLEFTMKEDGNFSRYSLLKRVAVPEEVNLDAVLQILKNNSIQIVETHIN